MDSGFLLYKCRRCGKITKTTHVPDGIIALSHIQTNTPMPKQWSGFASITDICSCEDGELGVADLIGFEKDK